MAEQIRPKLSTSRSAQTLGAMVRDDKIDRRKPPALTRHPMDELEIRRVKARVPTQLSACDGMTKELLRKDDIDDDRYSLTLDMLKDPPVVLGSSDRGGPYKLPKLADMPQSAISDYYATIVDFLRRQRQVFSDIYDPEDGVKNIMERVRATLGQISYEAAQEKRYHEKDLKLRWIHLPANNAGLSSVLLRDMLC